ncbi:serine/threonine-protein kinase [Tahibacter amnicola]|uniref:Serine/threonine-protein kinase n=1 Tax=Tahibacter amnicola TaxID=2976241 RepID=A0ABY6BG57_9GAMM|nr:serine/threonine-protein kinase [Tahibacter amnicola]UXI69004.1 serine/threonine-protein kinase [Tahibacter amnicola]
MASPTRFSQLRRLFEEVCDLSDTERRAHFHACSIDEAIVAEVEALIAAETRGLRRASTPVAALLANLPDTELDAGDRLGAWRLTEKLASGGMGAVYRAERADGHFQQQAAIKLLRGVPTAEALARLSAERQILAELQHPHIGRLLDGGSTPSGQPFLVMEFVDGVPIDRWCSERNLELGARLRLFRNVCRAVAFAHRRLVVHCDLKPSNILVRPDGSPVLLDFGIARALDRSREGETETFYTPAYASPEQMAGAPVTVASDVYSLGLVLFELVTGRKARMHADDNTVTELAHAARRPSELAADDCRWRQKLRGDLDAIILRATAQAAALRYASADALAEDIESHLDGELVAARAPTFAYRYGRLLRRRWPLFAGAAVVLVMAGLFSWRIISERDRAVAAEREARRQAQTAQQVSEFLISLFDYANPEKNPARRDITAREMLEESTRRMTTSLAEQPTVRARLTDVLARAWNMLGQPVRAAALYEESANLWQSAGPEFRAEEAASRSDLAVILTNHERDAEAERHARAALALREAMPQPDERAMADSWNTLGLVLLGEARFDEAETYLQRALETRRRLGEAGSVASTLHNLGLLYLQSGNIQKSIDAFAGTLAMKRKLYGGDRHPSTLVTMDNYARALSNAGRTEEALPLLESVLKLRRELDGYDSRNVCDAYNELGSSLHDAGRFREAAENYTQAMRIDGELAGKRGLDYVRPLNNLASAREDMGDYAAAEPLFRESLEIRQRDLGPDVPLVARAQSNLARVLMRQGRLAEARPYLDAALATRRAKLGDAHVDTARSQLQLADWMRLSGKHEEARRMVDELAHHAAPFTPQMQAYRWRLSAQLKSADADTEGALADFIQAQNAMARTWRETHPLTAVSMLDRAEAEWAAGHRDAAREWLTKAEPVLTRALAPVAPELTRIRQLKARLPGNG